MIYNESWKIHDTSLVTEINNKSFEINDLKAQLQDFTIVVNELKQRLAQLHEKSQVTKCESPDFDSRFQQIEDENVSLAFQVSSLRNKLYPVTPFPKTQFIPKVVEKNDLTKTVTSHLNTNKIIKKCTKVLASGLLKIDSEPINAYFKNNKVVDREYLKVTKEHVETLQELLEQATTLKPLNENLVYACKFAERIQELLVYVSASRPFTQSGNKKWAPATSHQKNNKPYIDASHKYVVNDTQKHVVKQNTQKTDNTMLPSIRRVSYTNASGSKPKSNTRNDSIPQPSSISKKNKVEAKLRKFKSSSNKNNHVSDCNANIKNVALSNNSANLAKQGLVEGLTKLKYAKDRLCSVRQMGKSKKESHQHKPKPSTNEKLQMMHMDLLIGDDHSCFTWVKFLRTKDEAPKTIIKFLKQAQVSLKVTLRYLRIDNGTKFINQTLRKYTEDVEITHHTSVARTSQQNGVVERRNRTLVESARTMLIFSKSPYRKPELKYLHVFGALCYPTNDSEDLGFAVSTYFDEYFKPLSVVSTTISAATLPPPNIAGVSSSTTIDQDSPSPSTSPNNETIASLINSTNIKQLNNEEDAEFNSDTFTNPFAPSTTSSAESSSKIVDTSNTHTFQQPHINTKR
ncbi:retrovirus-related pol polyprotein from transposon TNT 1-94 [Tanacetum coccineum]